MKRHRTYAVFLILVIAALVICTVTLSAITYFKGRGDANVKVLTTAQQFGAAYRDHVIVAFDPDGIAVADGTMTGTLSLLLPEGVRKQLVDTNTRQPIYTDCSNFCSLARDNNAQMQVAITAFDATGKPSAEIVKSFSLNEISQGFTDRVVEQISIPVTAFPNNYPDDSYKTGIFLFWGLPNNVNVSSGKDIPTDYELAEGGLAKTFDISIRHNSVIPGFTSENFVMSLQRTTPSRIYIYLVALVPLILALIFAHLLFFSRHAESKSFEEYAEALIVTILAGLPLRLVLVPPELTSLTRVDLLLGMGLVAIVAIAGLKYATEVWLTKPHHEHSEATHLGEPAHVTQPAPIGE